MGASRPARVFRSLARTASGTLLVAIAIVILLEVLASASHPRVTAAPAYIVESAGLAVDRLHAVYARDGQLYAVEDHFIYVSSDAGRSYRRLGSLPKEGGLAARTRDRVARSGLARRVRRYPGPKSLIVLSSGTIIVFYDRIYRSTDGGSSFEIVTNAEGLPGGFPSSVGYAVGAGDTIYYGEYTTAPRPNAVRVVRGVDDGQTWAVAYTFPPGKLFHIHSITYDPYRDLYWIAAGDEDDEPRLMHTSDHFKTIHTAGCCEQDWRLVDMIVTEEALYWGSDDDRLNPGIFRYGIESGRLERVADLPNPSYHAAITDDGLMAISTTYEPTSPHTRTSAPPAATSLWVSRNGTDWRRIVKLEGDARAYETGSRPQMQLPAGDPLPALFITPWFTEQHHFGTLRLRD